MRTPTEKRLLNEKSNPIQFGYKQQRAVWPVGAIGKCYQFAKVVQLNCRFLSPFLRTFMAAPTQFIFITCQVGSESLCKAELGDSQPDWKFAFSRPGFLTYKLPENHNVDPRFVLKSTFARSYGWSLGNGKADTANELCDQLLEFPHWKNVRHLHVWERDAAVPGTRGFEPGQSVLATEVGGIILDRLQSAKKPMLNRRATSDDLVFDVALIEPNWWWFGWHHAGTTFQRWPGGVPLFSMEPKISRAYYKLKEALLWSGVAIREEDVCVELGSSPGGAVQLLLEMGAKVIAVDPAKLDEEIANHSNLVHFRKRGREVRKKEFREARWLMADMNVAPKFTLDTVEDILTNENVNVSGIVLTLKMLEKSLASEVNSFRDRVRKWGFQFVKTRQLAFNRQEFCLVALRDKFVLRSGKKRTPKSKRPSTS